MTRIRGARLGGKRRFLLSISALLILLGTSYLGPSTPASRASVAFAVDPIPLGFYGTVFVLAGLVGIVSAFRVDGYRIGFVTLQFVCTGWGMAYLGSQFIDGYPRGFVLAGLFLGLGSAISSVAGLLDVPVEKK